MAAVSPVGSLTARRLVANSAAMRVRDRRCRRTGSTPTRRPAKRSRWRSNAASTVADDGSTTASCATTAGASRRRSRHRRPPALRRRGAHSSSKFGSPSVPRKPSQIVSGTKSVTRAPRCERRGGLRSARGFGEHRRLQRRRQRRGGERRAATPGRRRRPARSAHRARRRTGCSSSSAAVPWPAITRASV